MNDICIKSRYAWHLILEFHDTIVNMIILVGFDLILDREYLFQRQTKIGQRNYVLLLGGMEGGSNNVWTLGLLKFKFNLVCKVEHKKNHCFKNNPDIILRAKSRDPSGLKMDQKTKVDQQYRFFLRIFFPTHFDHWKPK